MLTRSEWEAYNEGYDAYLNGASETNNPYEVGTDLAMSWHDGFSAADNEDGMEDVVRQRGVKLIRVTGAMSALRDRLTQLFVDGDKA